MSRPLLPRTYTCRSVEQIPDDHRMRILEIPKTAAAIVTFRADCPRRHTHSSPLVLVVAGAYSRDRRRKSPRKQNTHTHTYTQLAVAANVIIITDIDIYCVCQASIQNYFGCMYYKYDTILFASENEWKKN